MKKIKVIALGAMFFLLFFSWFGRAQALPWGTILYHTSENGKMYGYNNFEFSPISGKFYPGAVGIYIGKSKKSGSPLVAEVDYGQVRIIPAQYFVDLDRGEEFVGAKIPQEFNYTLKAAKSMMRKIIAQEGELFDYTYAKQKGPQSGDWTSVGFVEKVYESISAPHLTYHPEPLMNYSHYDINITPDGFDQESKINEFGDCFSLTQEFSALHQFGQGDFWSQFAFQQLKDILKTLKTNIDLSQLLSLSVWGKNYGGDSYFFFPATQLNQKTLRDVDLDIEVASWGKSQIEGTRSPGLRRLDAVGAFTDRFIREAGSLAFRNVVAGKDSFLGSITNLASSVENWLSLGKKITDLAEASHIKIDLNFKENLNVQKGIDAALGLWNKGEEFVEFASQESSEIADLVRKGLLSGPRAETKFEDLIADIDISETLLTDDDSLAEESVTLSQKEQVLSLEEELMEESWEEWGEKLNERQEEEAETQGSEENENEEEDEQESEEQPLEQEDEALEEPSLPQYSPGEVVINELVADPETGQKEWIELFNNTNQDIDLDGWTIEDNTEAKKSLKGPTLKSSSWLVLNQGQGQDFSFSLNNAGDIIKLKYNDLIIDQIAYGNFDDGNVDDNAPSPSKGQSTARQIDGQDTDHDQNDFALTITPTKGLANLVNSPDITPPEITFDLYPDSLSNQTKAQFEFSSNEEVVFTCWLDDASPDHSCISPQIYDGLAEGSHVFYLEAEDQSGNVTTASYEWRIDQRAPISNINLAANVFNSFSWPQEITGTASLDGERANRLVKVKLAIQKQDSGEYLGQTTSTDALLWQDQFFWIDTLWEESNASSTEAVWSLSLESSFLSDGSYSLFSRAEDILGNVQNSTSTIDFIFDDTPPKKVEALSVERISDSRDLRITWEEPQDNLTGIDFYEINWLGYTTSTSDTFFELTGEDNQNYAFQVRAIDKAGNIGSWSEELEYSLQLPHVLFSEIQVADNEFIELYNPNEEDVSLENWYFAYYSSGRDWDQPYRFRAFPAGAKIKAKDYYLIGLKGYLGSVIDWSLYDECNFNLNNEAGSMALYAFDPSEKNKDYLRANYVDVFAWGNVAYVQEGDSVILESGQENYSWERKNNELNNSKIDLGNNQQDFFKQINPNPQSSQGLVNDFILFEDDFSTSLGDDWEFGGDGSSGWSVVEGRGQVDLNVPETASRILAGDFDWRNYQVDFDLLFYRGVDRHFIFGYQDVDNYYRLVFLGKFLSWQPALRLEKIQGGENYLLLNEEYPLDYLFNDQQEHDLTLGVNDNLIQVYLDNEKMMEYVLTDTDFLPQGKIGFGVWTGDSASEKFSFDNLKVKTFFNGLSLTDTIDLPFVESFNSAQFDSWRQTGPYNCPLTLWQGTCPENAWQVVDNQAQIDLNGRNLYSRLLTGDPSWENYQLDVDLRLKKGVTRYILLRYQSQENYYQISLQGFWRYDFSTPAIYLDKFVANEKTELARYFFPGKIYFNQDQEYHLTAIVDENHLKIYLDGEKLIDYIDDDSPLTYGKIGFGVWSGHSEEGDMNFDNLRVQQVSNFPNLPLISQPMVSEDFSEGQADSWEEVGPLVWEVRDGQYGMSVVGQRNLRAQTFIGNYSWQDYVIEFDVNLGLGVERYVRFRYADQENYYQLSFMGKWRDAWLPHLRLYRFSTHDGDQVLSEVNVLPYTFNYSEFHHVKIVVQGESIKVYLNDSAEPILDVLDEGTRLTRGKFGLGVWTGDDKNAIVCWDNITINPLD